MRSLSLLAVLAFALAFGRPAIAVEESAANPSYKGLWISTPYPSLSVPPGEPVELELTVHNAGLPPQRVALAVTSAPEGWNSVFLGGGRPVEAVFAAPDSDVKVSMRLLAPDTIDSGSHRFVVAATGDDGRFNLPIEISFGNDMPARLRLETELPALRGSPNSNFEYAVTLTNESGREALAKLEAAAEPGFRVTFKERYGSQELTSVPVKAGEKRDLKVVVEPRQDTPAGIHQVAVRAVTEAGNAELPLTLDVTGRAELTLAGANDRLSGEASAGEETPLTLVVANRGTSPANEIKFSASQPSGWKVTFDPETIDTLPAGEEREVTAMITPSSKAIAGDYMVTLRANGDGASKSSEFRITVETSTLWGIVGVLVIGAAVVVLSLAVMRFGRR